MQTEHLSLYIGLFPLRFFFISVFSLQWTMLGTRIAPMSPLITISYYALKVFFLYAPLSIVIQTFPERGEEEIEIEIHREGDRDSVWINTEPQEHEITLATQMSCLFLMKHSNGGSRQSFHPSLLLNPVPGVTYKLTCAIVINLPTSRTYNRALYTQLLTSLGILLVYMCLTPLPIIVWSQSLLLLTLLRLAENW